MKRLLYFLLIHFSIITNAQDTLMLELKQLGREDVQLQDIEDEKTVLTGSRSLEGVKKLPFTFYVITKEEIQQNGYITLVDVLRSLPGIRVSQPGSAIDGETFIMRGLYGNRYAKILINDLPVRPSVLTSMPIGAQLPIQQAERIEVTFGPSIGIHGADANAGVINIITAETERPFYVQADVGLGSFGLHQLSVSLGGKLGKDKQVLKFNIFGNYLDVDDRAVVYDKDNLYNPLTYFADSTAFQNLPNYVGGRPDQPVVKSLPYQSELVGFRLRYRNFRFDFERMERNEYSSIGLNPATASYAKPALTSGENISRFSGGWKEEFKKWSLRTDITTIFYEQDLNTSNEYILTELNRGVLAWENAENLPSAYDNTNFRALAEETYNKYLNNVRFSHTAARDIYIEPLVGYKPLEWLDLTLGGSLQFFNNTPFIDYLPIPFQVDEDENEQEVLAGVQRFAIAPDELTYSNIGLFFQQSFSFKFLNLLSAIRYDNHSEYGAAWTARLGMSYTLGDFFTFRANYGNAWQAPSPNFNARTTAISVFPDSILLRLATPIADTRILPERTNSYEFGISGSDLDRINPGIIYFRSKTDPLTSYFSQQIIGSPLTSINGFTSRGASVVVRGWQGRLRVGLGERTEAYLNFQRTTGEEILPAEGGKLEQVRMQPKWLWQARLSTELGRNWYLQTVFTRSQEWVSRNLTDASLLEEESERSRYMVPRYATLDLMLRYQLTNTFQGYVSAFNVFNNEYGGIGATGSPDDLLYNPQQLRVFRVGLSYKMK